MEASLAAEVWFTAVGPAGGRALAMLSEDEIARARRFVSEDARRRFVAGRVLLRELIGEFLEAPPGSLRFVQTPGGKPELAEPWGGMIEFSVSHSGDLVAAAASRAGAVGIDVEATRPVRRALALAERYFQPDAAALVERLAGPERDAAFLQYWTRLEATAKTTGRGMAAILTGAREQAPHAELDVDDLRLPQGYVGALAASPPA